MNAKELGQQAAYPVDSRDTGLTKREVFAMALAQGIASNPDATSHMREDLDRTVNDKVEIMAASAVKYADAILAELAKDL